jgi:hypothetical protein
MPGANGSRKRKGGGRGACSYCGRVHKKGRRRGDSCRGHGGSIRADQRKEVRS